MPNIDVKTVCVVGGSGFLGSHVVAKALERGWKVNNYHKRKELFFLKKNMVKMVALSLQVNATMRDANDEAKKAWLNKIPKAEGVKLQGKFH